MFMRSRALSWNLEPCWSPNMGPSLKNLKNLVDTSGPYAINVVATWIQVGMIYVQMLATSARGAHMGT